LGTVSRILPGAVVITLRVAIRPGLDDAVAEQSAQRSFHLIGPVDYFFRALSGGLNFTVRRHKFNEDSLFHLIIELPGVIITMPSPILQPNPNLV
jgi:hypothetical protein